MRRPLIQIVLIALVLIAAGCDHGFAPPDEPPSGVIRALISYEGAWPIESDVHDLRFVAMRFVPRDTADFLQLNRMAISDRLPYGVRNDTVTVEGVETGGFLYSGVAQQFEANLLAWRPVGLFSDNEGVFFVTSGDTTDISLTVDFDDPPPFPPPGS
jgi:hypothetical protein